MTEVWKISVNLGRWLSLGFLYNLYHSMLGGGGVDFLYQFGFSVPRFSNNRVQAGVARQRPLIARRSHVVVIYAISAIFLSQQPFNNFRWPKYFRAGRNTTAYHCRRRNAKATPNLSWSREGCSSCHICCSTGQRTRWLNEDDFQKTAKKTKQKKNQVHLSQQV